MRMWDRLGWFVKVMPYMSNVSCFMVLVFGYMLKVLGSVVLLVGIWVCICRCFCLVRLIRLSIILNCSGVMLLGSVWLGCVR